VPLTDPLQQPSDGRQSGAAPSGTHEAAAPAASNAGPASAHEAPETDWKRLFEGMTIPELTRIEAEMAADYRTRTQVEVNARFDAGMGELISGEDKRYEFTEDDDKEISGVRLVPGRGTFRLVLPRDEFEDLYLLREQRGHVQRLIAAKQRAALPKR